MFNSENKKIDSEQPTTIKKLPNYLNRISWQARKPKYPLINRKILRPEKIIVHYNGGKIADTKINARGIQKFHLDTRGWRDVAYNFLIGQQIFLGRGYWAQNGAHPSKIPAGKFANEKCIAIMFLLGGKQEIPEYQKQNFRNLKSALDKLARKNLKIEFHSDISSTNCPGLNLKKWIKSEFHQPKTRISTPKREKKAVVKTVKKGSKVEIIQIQQLLNVLFVKNLTFDGIFGSRTLAAFRSILGKREEEMTAAEAIQILENIKRGIQKACGQYLKEMFE